MVLILAHDSIDHAFGIAAVVFFVAAATDFFDGWLARRWNITSTLGAFLDTVADKLLVTGTLFALVEVGRAWAWAAFVIVGRELVVTGLRGLAALDGTTVPPSWAGKAKANVQYLAIVLAMMRLSDTWGPLYLDQWVMVAAVAVTIYSGYAYFARFGQVLRPARR